MSAVTKESRSIPSTLTLIRIGLAALVVLAMACVALQQLVAAQRTDAAAADTAQLARVQGIKTDLLHADALATNAFLIGGLEPAQQRAAYDGAIESATQAVTDAAQAQPADRAVLSKLSSVIVNYATLMEQARATNRQGLPVGTAYLKDASTLLRGEGIALVDALVDANKSRATGALSGWLWLPLLLAGVLAAAGLVIANQWIAARFHRRVNVGIALALLAVSLATVAAAFTTVSQFNENTVLRQGNYRLVVDLSQARSAANDAKSNESLRLISRGSGQANETAWAAASAQVVSLLPDVSRVAGSGTADWSELVTRWDAYTAEHAQIVQRDIDGQWDQAVALATAQTASAQAFSTFDSAIAARIATAQHATSQSLNAGSAVPLVVSALAGLAGLAAAGLIWWGIGRRLEEYS